MGHLSKAEYKQRLRALQIELVTLQKHIICNDLRVLILLEGRDASGKDGLIKRITAHTSPRETRVVAPGKPTEREGRAWYFQRYVDQLPVDGEMVLFNRSWYNRAGVEKVMGFCDTKDYELFYQTVNDFENLLVKSGTLLLKYYLDISRDEQERRLEQRRLSPFKQWKISPVDEAALDLFDEYSQARNRMLVETSTSHAPWTVVRADDKRRARINVISDILDRIDCPALDQQLLRPDEEIITRFDVEVSSNFSGLYG